MSKIKSLNKVEDYFNNGDNIFPKPMSDHEFKRIITDYLLGEDWYTVNPVSDEQCNVYIAQAIIKKYKRKH
jgi:hypothetical protein